MKTVILAAGKPKPEISVLVPPGSNKVLLHILGRPVLYYPLKAVEQALKSEIVLVYRDGEEKVYREASKYTNSMIKPVPQISGDTVADAIIAAEESLNDTDHFLLVFGDIVFDHTAISQLLSTHLSEEPDATILATPLIPEHASTYGLIKVDDEGYVKKVIEEPRSISEEPYYISGGLYVLPTTILDLIKKYKSFTKALNHLAINGKVKTVYWTGLWIDIGYPWDLLEAVHQLLYRIKDSFISNRAEIETSAIIKGPVIIEEKTYIDHNAVIKGPAYIGKESFIGAHSFIRNYSNIEMKNRIGSYAEIKNSITQPYTLLDSKVILADSIVGENTIIGAMSITLNILPKDEKPPRLRTHLVNPASIKVQKRKLGAVIGYNVKINPGTILKPGSIIKPNTVIQHIEPLHYHL